MSKQLSRRTHLRSEPERGAWGRVASAQTYLVPLRQVSQPPRVPRPAARVPRSQDDGGCAPMAWRLRQNFALTAPTSWAPDFAGTWLRACQSPAALGEKLVRPPLVLCIVPLELLLIDFDRQPGSVAHQVTAVLKTVGWAKHVRHAPFVLQRDK